MIALNFTEAELTQILRWREIAANQCLDSCADFEGDAEALFERIVSARAALWLQKSGDGQ